jgi:glycolate oxidase
LEVPLGVLRGTAVLNGFYRLCGARIGRGVRLDSVTLSDLELIAIDDDASIGRDANLQPAHIHDGMLLRQPVHVGSRCVVGSHVSVLGGTSIAAGAHIPSLSVAGNSPHLAESNSQADIGDAQRHEFSTAAGAAYRALGYLVVGYLTTASIFVGVMFVRMAVTSLGADVPSISDIAFGKASPSSVPLAFFAAVAIALYLVMPICYFGLVASLKRLLLEKLKPGTVAPDRWRIWSHWLYSTLIDVPFFKMYLRLTVGSHLTKWSFQLLGSQIGARPFLAAPYTAEPELLEMADFAMLAGNVSLYGVDIVSGTAEKISLQNSAIVANSCVLHGGAHLAECSLLGDLSTAGNSDVIPPNAIAVGVPPRIVGRTSFHPDEVSRGEYVRNQTLLILLQIALLAISNIAGFCVLGLLARNLVSSAWAFWLALPVLLLAPRLVKVLFLPIFKWLVVGRVSAGDYPLYGWFYTRWQLVETVLWDAEDAILGQLHGMPLLSLLWRAFGARVGANACILSSSLACEYDLKDIGDAVVLNQQSVVFGHSIEHHSLLLRPTTLEDGAEIGSFAIVEAGGLVRAGRVVSPHVAVHANQVRRGPAVTHDTAPKRDLRTANALARPHVTNSGTRAADKRVRSSATPIPEGDLNQRFQVLHEFVKAAREKLDRDSWDYLIGAAETETTYARNRLALDSLGLRPRVLRDVSNINSGTTLFGKRLRIPVLCAPVGALESFDPSGAASVAQAVDRFGIGLAVSSVSQPGLEQTAAESGQALKIFQLYVRGDEAWVDDHIRRAIACGYDAFCLTVDTDLYSRRERDIAKRHERRRVRVANETYQARFKWRDVARIKKTFEIPLILKGIAVAEDAEIAVDHGVECVYVSNHGGRQLDHGLGAVAVLPEIVEAVAGRAKIIVDGAITRGSDVVKAIALGADAVAVGRLYVYGLSAASTPGVVRLFEILEDEIRICLGLLGVATFAELSKKYVREAPAVVRAHLHSAFPHLDLPDDKY